MSPDQTRQLIRRVRAGFYMAAALKMVLLLAVVGSLLGLWRWLAPNPDPRIDTFVLLASVGVWVGLSVAGGAAVRLVQTAAGYSAGGQDEVAERVLLDAAKGFSLFRGQRLLVMQNLAWIAHAAGRFKQAAMLSGFVVTHLGRSRRLARAFDHPNRLLLADSEVMLGELSEAQAELNKLDRDDLSLPEQLAKLATTCYFEVSAGLWGQLADEASGRSRMARLMPPAQAATTLACLALGCQNLGRLPQRDWLWREATLLLDRSDLVMRLPLLEPLPASAATKLPWDEDEAASGESE